MGIFHETYPYVRQSQFQVQNMYCKFYTLRVEADVFSYVDHTQMTIGISYHKAGTDNDVAQEEVRN